MCSSMGAISWESLDYVSALRGHNDRGHFTRRSRWCRDHPLGVCVCVCVCVCVKPQSFHTGLMKNKIKRNTFHDPNRRHIKLESIFLFIFAIQSVTKVYRRSRALGIWVVGFVIKPDHLVLWVPIRCETGSSLAHRRAVVPRCRQLAPRTKEWMTSVYSLLAGRQRADCLILKRYTLGGVSLKWHCGLVHSGRLRLQELHRPALLVSKSPGKNKKEMSHLIKACVLTGLLGVWIQNQPEAHDTDPEGTLCICISRAPRW